MVLDRRYFVQNWMRLVKTAFFFAVTAKFSIQNLTTDYTDFTDEKRFSYPCPSVKSVVNWIFFALLG